MLEWAGLNFGPEYAFMLQKSLKRLALMSGASRIRFYGRIFGRDKDYIIAQGTMDEAEEDSKNPQQEIRGTGVNANVYWVCTNLLGDWVQLPEA